METGCASRTCTLSLVRERELVAGFRLSRLLQLLVYVV